MKPAGISFEDRMSPKYKSKVRTTLDQTDDLPYAGIYIIAYMGRVLYVGKASESIVARLLGHWRRRDTEILGDWMDRVKPDWMNIRLDVLEAPDDCDLNYWLRTTEAELVNKFKPLFNEQLMG